jgi:hypothetical protein
MGKNLYMHLLDGKPAEYQPDGQICFVGRFNTLKFEDMFVDSLDKIKRQQRASEAWRKSRGFDDSFKHQHSYIRIKAAN